LWDSSDLDEYNGAEIPVREKLAAIKIFKVFTMVKVSETHQTIADRRGPVIGLPEMKPDSVKLEVIEGGKADA